MRSISSCVAKTVSTSFKTGVSENLKLGLTASNFLS